MGIKRWIKTIATEAVQEKIDHVHAILDAEMAKNQRVMDLARDVERELDRLKALTDEIDARIDRGNKLWRAIRARERRAAELEEVEGFDDPRQGFLPLDGGGGEEDGLPDMPDVLEDGHEHLAPHERFAKEFARSLLTG